MYVRRMVVECDFSGKKYDEPVEGGAAVARGASGRWCEVMWAGPEWLEENGHEPVNHAAAVAWVENQHPADRVDF